MLCENYLFANIAVFLVIFHRLSVQNSTVKNGQSGSKQIDETEKIK